MRNGRLWFSDFQAHAVKSVAEDGQVRVEVELDDQPSGLGWLPDGSMLVVSMIKRRVLRGAAGELLMHADLSGLAPFHCNDMVVDAQGRAYVGNFHFDPHGEVLARGLADFVAHHPTTNLILVDPDGSARRVASDLHFPNGSAITPDGRILIVAETLACRLTAFNIQPHGDLTGRRVFASLPPRGPDGSAFDAEGAVRVANPFHPECVRVSPAGRVVEAIATDHPCYACALCGVDGRTLFMLPQRARSRTRCPHRLRPPS